MAEPEQMRVLIMNPPSGLYRRDDRCQSKVDDQTVRVIFPPIELAVLAAVARECGALVLLRDYPATGATPGALLDDARAFAPALILFSTTIHTLRQECDMLREVRAMLPGVRIVAKGESVAHFAERVLADHPEIDAIMHGEPEETFRALVRGTELSAVEGAWWRDAQGQVRRNAPRPLIASLDTLPLPARDMLDNAIYRSPENGRPITAIHAQRGCPSKCIFCPAGGMFGYCVRERSPANILDEIEACVNDHGIRDFLFHGDTFTLHKKWLIELCHGIVERGLDIHWGCNSRVDTIDDERARWLRLAGCWVVAFGFEHGVQEMLDRMKKGTRVEKAFDAVAVCRRNGLRAHGFFVVGLPWETAETLEQTYRFARRLDLDFFDFNIAYPLPGTELYDIATKEGLLDEAAFYEGGYARAALRTFALPPEYLTAWRRRALLRMYARPRYIARTLFHAAKDGNAGHYARAAMRRLSSLVRRAAP